MNRAAYCHACGRELAAAPSELARDDLGPRRAVHVVDDSRDRLVHRRRRTWRPGIAADDDTEQELWSDTFSAKGMINYWVLIGAVSVIAPVASRLMRLPPAANGTLVAVIGGMWCLLFAAIVYQKLDHFYVLTTQRFLHKNGILTRHTRRIEVIDIDDISYRQGLLERFVGVGTIEIVSSDETDPVFELIGVDRVHDVAELMDEARRRERIRRGLHIESV